MSVLGKTAEEYVQHEQYDGEYGAQTESNVKRLIITGLVLVVQGISHKLGLVVQDH